MKARDRRSAATSSSSGCGARAKHRYHDHHRYHVLMHDGKLTAVAAPAMGAEPVLLPDARPDQGRHHPVEVRGPGVPADVDPPHPRPRRRRGRRRRARAVAASGRRRGTRPRGGRELPLGAAGRAASPATATSSWCASARCSRPVASSLTEFFSPDLMTKRGAGLGAALSVDQPRHPRLLPHAATARAAGLAGGHRLRDRATPTTYELQARCVAALIRKTEILWHLLDSLYAGYVEPGWGPGGAVPERRSSRRDARPRLAPKARLRWDRKDESLHAALPGAGPRAEPDRRRDR